MLFKNSKQVSISDLSSGTLTISVSWYENLEKEFYVFFEHKFCSTQQPGLRKGREKNMTMSLEAAVQYERRMSIQGFQKP